MHDCAIDRASLPRVGELLCVCDRSWLLLPQKVELRDRLKRDRLWLRFCGWPSCFACVIDRGFVATDGRGLVARS